MSSIGMQEGQEVVITVTAKPDVKDSVMRAVSRMLAGEGINCHRIECGYTKDVASFVRQRQPSPEVRKDEILKAWPAEGLTEADLCAWTVQTASNMTPSEAWLYALESEESDMYRAARVRLAMGCVRGEGEVISESPTLCVRRLRDKINREQARAQAEPVNSLDAAILEELKAIRKAVEGPTLSVVMEPVTLAPEPRPEADPSTLVGGLRLLAHRVRSEGCNLRPATIDLAATLGYSDRYRRGEMEPAIQVLAQKMVGICGHRHNTPELFDVAGQFLGATGGAYRG